MGRDTGMIGAIYAVSEGDIKNGNIRFADAPFLYPVDAVGGTNVSEPAQGTIDVTFVPGGTTKQWLYGDKKIMNNRNPVTKAFFEAIGAVAGTRLAITRTGSHSIQIQKL